MPIDHATIHMYVLCVYAHEMCISASGMMLRASFASCYAHMQDALFALAYGQHRSGKPSWARAHALHAAVLEAAMDNTPAALAFQKAVELRPGVPVWQAALERLLRRIPDSHAAALKVLRGSLKNLGPGLVHPRRCTAGRGLPHMLTGRRLSEARSAAGA